MFRAEVAVHRSFSETLVSTYESARRHNPEEYHHLHRREDLKSQIVNCVVLPEADRVLQ
jgi:hypothetical protein